MQYIDYFLLSLQVQGYPLECLVFISRPSHMMLFIVKIYL